MQVMENIIENNKPIAEFMGWTVDDIYLETYRKRINGKFKYVHESQLKYDTDWNHLMPVVAKITQDESFIGNMYRENLMEIVPFGVIKDVYHYVIIFLQKSKVLGIINKM